MEHVVESMEFSVKYINVIFKWLSTERKQGAIQLIDHLSQKEQFLSHRLLEEFTKNIDSDIKEPFLKQLQQMTARRLKVINSMLEVP
jgi:hypothetical protein